MRDVVDRSARHTFGIQLLDPERDGLGAENGFELGDQYFAVTHAIGVAPVACIAGEVRCADDGTKLDELRVISNSNDYVAVGCGNTWYGTMF